MQRSSWELVIYFINSLDDLLFIGSIFLLSYLLRFSSISCFFFLNDPAPPETSSLPLHDALPISPREPQFHKLRPGRPTSPVDGPAFYFPGAGAPDFVAIPVPGLRPQLRQYDCPNSDHAKFFSTTQAPESRRSHATSVLRRGRPPRPGFEVNAPRSGPRTAGFSDEVAAGTKGKNALGAGALQERVGDEAVHRVGHLRRAGCHGRRGKCANFGAV